SSASRDRSPRRRQSAGPVSRNSHRPPRGRAPTSPARPTRGPACSPSEGACVGSYRIWFRRAPEGILVSFWSVAVIRIPPVLVLAYALAGGQVEDASRLNQHRVANRNSPAPEPGAESQLIPSLIDGLSSAQDWEAVRRPQLLRLWTTILGKLDPNSEDLKWFGDIRHAVIRDRADRGSYTRTALDLPIEKDLLQHHLLLEPKGPGPFPAVICWTSTTPDYTAPEEWWGKWLAEHGYVVLTSWSFLRYYRDGSTYRDGAAAKLYERFGHWLPMAKMVHDARREAEYLRSLKHVDGSRIGFMGFSLSAKAAVYIGAFAPEIAATVAIDPHIATNGGPTCCAPCDLS